MNISRMKLRGIKVNKVVKKCGDNKTKVFKR